MVTNWKNSRIYRLVCDDNKFYIGSTVLTLEKRFYQHKRNAIDGKSKVYRHIRAIGGPEKVRIELVAENFNISTRDELLKIEDRFIREGFQQDAKNCLNRNRPRATEAERAQRQAIKKRMWAFFRNHPSDKPIRERIIEYCRTHKIKHYKQRPKATDLFTCECSMDVPFKDLKRHRQTKKHQAEFDSWNVMKTILFESWKTANVAGSNPESNLALAL